MSEISNDPMLLWVMASGQPLSVFQVPVYKPHSVFVCQAMNVSVSRCNG